MLLIPLLRLIRSCKCSAKHKETEQSSNLPKREREPQKEQQLSKCNFQQLQICTKPDCASDYQQITLSLRTHTCGSTFFEFNKAYDYHYRRIIIAINEFLVQFMRAQHNSTAHHHLSSFPLSPFAGHHVVPKQTGEAETRHGGAEEGRGERQADDGAEELPRKRQRHEPAEVEGDAHERG
jgi:hypothetical protein